MSINILESADSSEIRELRAEILSKRSMGDVVFEIKQIRSDVPIENAANLTEILDLFVSQIGYLAIGDCWKEIAPEAAQKILVFFLTKDLAYSSEIMTLEEAEQICTKMFSFFKSNCKFFTNAVFVNNYSALRAWKGITQATFDTGVIFVCDTLIGILWVKDED
jgi:hypothetical protein